MRERKGKRVEREQRKRDMERGGRKGKVGQRI